MNLNRMSTAGVPEPEGIQQLTPGIPWCLHHSIETAKLRLDHFLL